MAEGHRQSVPGETIPTRASTRLGLLQTRHQFDEIARSETVV